MSQKKTATAREQRKRRVTASIKTNSIPFKVTVQRTNLFNYAQIVDCKDKKTVLSESDMKIKNGTRTEKAKQVGLKLAKTALEKNIKEAVFDRRSYKYHGRVKAMAEGLREGGLKI